MKKLLGRWSGKSSPVSFTHRFERKADAKLAVFVDDAKIGSEPSGGLMVVKATMNDSELSLRTPFLGPEIRGKLSFFGNRINGRVTVMEADYPPRYLTTPVSLIKD